MDESKMERPAIIQRAIANSLKELSQILKETYIYPVVGAFAAVPLIFALAGAITYFIMNSSPSAREPRLRQSADPNAMIWSYPGEYQARNFKDVKPFGSLDEVVLRTQDGKVITLRPGDEGFEKQERVYNDKIMQSLNK